MVASLSRYRDKAATYYVGIRADAAAQDTTSNYSIAMMVVMPEASLSETVTELQRCLDELQILNRQFFPLLLLPDDEVLSSAERMRLQGSGVRRYGYVDKLSDIAAEYPQFWPAFVGGDDDAGGGSEQLKTLIREIEVLRNLVIALRNGAQKAEDMLLLVGNDAFRLANFYYRNVRDAARSKLPEAQQVFAMLKQFWNKRRRIKAVPTHSNAGRSPTERQVQRDANALIHGTADGSLYLENESDHFVEGEKTVIDNVRPKQRGGVRVEEREEVE